VRAPQHDELLGELSQWLDEREDVETERVRARLKQWVPEYQPTGSSEAVVGAEPLGKARQA
jgi:hypothetical protein